MFARIGCAYCVWFDGLAVLYDASPQVLAELQLSVGAGWHHANLNWNGRSQRRLDSNHLRHSVKADVDPISSFAHRKNYEVVVRRRQSVFLFVVVGSAAVADGYECPVSGSANSRFEELISQRL